MTFSLEPLRFLLHPVALLAFAAAGQAWLDGAATRGIVAAVIGVLIAAATEAARSKVTPQAKLRRRGEAGLTTVELLLILCAIGIGVLLVALVL